MIEGYWLALKTSQPPKFKKEIVIKSPLWRIERKTMPEDTTEEKKDQDTPSTPTM